MQWQGFSLWLLASDIQILYVLFPSIYKLVKLFRLHSGLPSWPGQLLSSTLNESLAQERLVGVGGG